MIYLFILALVFALLEIEIEGKYAWSEKTQTWYRYNPKSLINKFLGGKPLTGYHIMVFGTAVLISHLPFIFGLVWSIQNELWILAIHFAWTPLWDYLWIVFNPHYGISEFKQNKTWWYQNSVWLAGVMPMEQIVQWGISVLFAILANKFVSQIQLLGGFALLTLISHYTLVPIYRKWYWQMRKSDDRNKVNIFH